MKIKKMGFSLEKMGIEYRIKGSRNQEHLTLILRFLELDESFKCRGLSSPFLNFFLLILQLGSCVKSCWKFEEFRCIKETFLAKGVKA